jgi:PAS domain S-box-containing protein
VSQDITERKQAEEQLKRNEEQFRLLIENSSDVITKIDHHQNFAYISPSIGRMLGYKAEDLIGQSAFRFIHPDDSKSAMEAFFYVLQNPGVTKTVEHRLKHDDGSWRAFQTIGIGILDESGNRLLVANSRDISLQKNLENQLAQAQKLEAIGSLAAGIAHEINTPTQYVGDNTRFFKDAFNDLNQLLQKYEELSNAVRAGSATDGVVQEIEAIAQTIDLAYLTEEIPKAIHQTLEGVERVTKIVQAMKEFSHPGAKEKTYININKAIENTITVARNEWKYVAEMVPDLDPSMPLVPCLPGELNQVILNMIINAAHAIADVVGDGSKGKGTIAVSTRHDGKWAEIRVRDTGTGIPENIRPRIFDPFFTTKGVGKGTGQGLTISHSVIVDKHTGTIHFDTEVGKGTTFIIRLPLEDIKMQGLKK